MVNYLHGAQNTHHLLCVCIVYAGELASIAACIYVVN